MAVAERKPGLYLCEGCGIAEAVSVGDLFGLATGEMRLQACRRHEALCSEAGTALIARDVDGGTVDQAIIAACSPRVMADRFQFAGAEVIRVNLREQVAWTQAAGEEDTQMLAADNVRMGVAEAARREPPEPHGEATASNKLLVVGGGVAGLTAADEAARSGLDVVLVEKSDQLGGWARKWSRILPDRPPYREPQPNDIEELIARVEGNPAIQVLTDTLVVRTAGGPGNFEVTFGHGGTESREVVGAIVVATGWRPYDTGKLAHLGYGVSADIVTDIEFEALLAAPEIKRPSDGARPENAIFVLSGEPERMPYASGVSDRIAIKQALQLLEAVPDAMVYVLYEDLRAHGLAEEFYRRAQEAGIVFQKGRVISASPGPTLEIEDELLGETVTMAGLDLVVLASGMVANATNIDLAPAASGQELLADDIDPARPHAPRPTAGGCGARLAEIR